MANTRIPFSTAISEPRLLGTLFDPHPEDGKPPFLSTAQRAWLKIIYGCSLDRKSRDDRGWTEYDFWAASQDRAQWDAFGYLKGTKSHTYKPKEYREAWGICGIRSGKTDRLAATIVAYEAVCGGHESFVRKGRPVICFQIAQDTKMAKYSLHSIKQTLESMAFVKANSSASMIRNVVADRIELTNDVTIAVTPPTIKSIRGYDSPVAVLDEVGVWYQEQDSANPDVEIYSQVSSRQAQFEFPKIIGISSPWNRAGLLWHRSEAGTEGCKLFCPSCRASAQVPGCPDCTLVRRPHQGRVVLYGTTASSNPIISKAWLVGERDKDPRSFERECLARFQDSLSGFLSSALIEKARCPGVTKRPAEGGNFYVGAIDPAFRRDAFGFTIVHADPKEGIVQDWSQRWFNSTGTPLDPGDIFPLIAEKLQEYGIKSVFSDQYTIEALNFIAQQYGFSIEEVTFSAGSKAEIYANLQSLLNQGKLKLLDDQDTITELKIIEKRNTQGGQVQISAPEGSHDDMATVLAIAAKEAVWMLPRKTGNPIKPKGIIERHIEQVAAQSRSRRIASAQDDW